MNIRRSQEMLVGEASTLSEASPKFERSYRTYFDFAESHPHASECTPIFNVPLYIYMKMRGDNTIRQQYEECVKRFINEGTYIVHLPTRLDRSKGRVVTEEEIRVRVTPLTRMGRQRESNVHMTHVLG